MSERIKKAKEELTKAYEVTGISIINEALDIIFKYQTMSPTDPDFSIEEMQRDSIVLTSINFTLHTYTVKYEAEADRKKSEVKFERAREFNAQKVIDPKMSDKKCEYIAEEKIYETIKQEIEARKTARYLDVAWQRAVDVVNMLKKIVERSMWQGPQAT